MLDALAEPTRGTASVFGRGPREAVATGLVGAMLQSGGLLDDATVAETVALFRAMYPKPLPVKETLNRAGLTELAGRKVGGLSGGEKQRVRFAVALVSDPDLLVEHYPAQRGDAECK